METQKTMKFLMGLGDNYATVRSNIIGMDPLPTVNKAYAMALRHEKQAEASNGKVVVPNEASAFSVRKLDQDPNTTEREVKCEKCNMTNHSTKNCRAHLKLPTVVVKVILMTIAVGGRIQWEEVKDDQKSIMLLR